MNTTIHTQKLAVALALAIGVSALVGCSDDGGMAPEMNAPVPVSSSFEEGTDGWRGAGDYENLGTGRTRPVQGFYLTAGDRATGDTWYFVAPSKFEGDKSRFYGGTISYYLTAGLTSGAAIRASDYFGAPDVVISGAGMTLLYRFSIMVYPDPNSFKEYLVTLSPSPSWRIESTGELATADQMRAVLADVERVFIRGEYLTGDDYAKIDEVFLEGPQ